MSSQTNTSPDLQTALSPIFEGLETKKISIHRALYPLNWLMTSIQSIVNSEALECVNSDMLREVEAAAHATCYLLPALEESGTATQSETEAFRESLSELMEVLSTRNEQTHIANVYRFLNTDAKEREDGLWVLGQTFHARLSQKACETENQETALLRLSTSQTAFPQELKPIESIISSANSRLGAEETRKIIQAALRKALEEQDRSEFRKLERAVREEHQEALKLDELLTQLSFIISDGNILDVCVRHFKTLAEAKNHKSKALPSSSDFCSALECLEERIEDIRELMQAQSPQEEEEIKKMISCFPSLLVDDSHLSNLSDLNDILGLELLTLFFKRSPLNLGSLLSNRSDFESFTEAVNTRRNLLSSVLQGQQIFSDSFVDEVLLLNPDFLLDESSNAIHSFEHKLRKALRLINEPGMRWLISQSERADILNPEMCQNNFSSSEAIQNIIEFVEALGTAGKQEDATEETVAIEAEDIRRRKIERISQSKAVRGQFKGKECAAAELIYITLEKGTLHHGERLSGHRYRGRNYVERNIRAECSRRGKQGLADHMMKDVILFLITENVIDPYKSGGALRLEAHPDKVSDPVLQEALKYFLSLPRQNNGSPA